MDEKLRKALTQQGFKYSKSGAHAARSMMIKELQQLFAVTDTSANDEVYREAVLTFNALQKATGNSRKLTLGHLKDLYGLSPDIPLFFVFRQWWDVSEAAQPLLALQLAIARDPLLRGSVPVILQRPPGVILLRSDMEAYLSKDDPDRFSPASLQSIARNINGSWTQAAYLTGKVKKVRQPAPVSFVNVAYALFQAHCQGLSGQRLFDSEWCRLLDCDQQTLFQLAHTASLHGLINFKHASEVVEVTFPLLKEPR